MFLKMHSEIQENHLLEMFILFSKKNTIKQNVHLCKKLWQSLMKVLIISFSYYVFIIFATVLKNICCVELENKIL